MKALYLLITWDELVATDCHNMKDFYASMTFIHQGLASLLLCQEYKYPTDQILAAWVVVWENTRKSRY